MTRRGLPLWTRSGAPMELWFRSVAAIWFITGTDTGVGKTVFSTALTRRLRGLGVAVRAVKPLCSGGREDAEALFRAQEGELALDAINPWNFQQAIAPVLAARAEGVRITRVQVLRFLRSASRGCDLLLVEGAGGLLSPMGEGFDSRDLIVALRARPWIICPDRIGAVGQGRMVWESLPKSVRTRAQLVLMAQETPDPSVESNGALLAEWIRSVRLRRFPFLSSASRKGAIRPEPFAGIDTLLRTDIRGAAWGTTAKAVSRTPRR